jgi:hypothetical protein
MSRLRTSAVRQYMSLDHKFQTNPSAPAGFTRHSSLWNCLNVSHRTPSVRDRLACSENDARRLLPNEGRVCD